MNQEFFREINKHYKNSTIQSRDLSKIMEKVLIDDNEKLFNLAFVKANNHCLVCGQCCKGLKCLKLAGNLCSIWQDDDYPDVCANYPYYDNGEISGLVLNEKCNYSVQLAIKMVDIVLDEVFGD